MSDYVVTIKPIPWKRGLLMLEEGSGFALYPPYSRPKDRPYINCSTPILEEKLVLFVTKQLMAKRKLTNWPEDFYGLKIGKNAGFSLFTDAKTSEAIKSGKIIIDEAKNNKTNILKLGMGRIDAYVNDRLSILWELSRLKKDGTYNEGGKHLEIVEGPTISTEKGYLGFTNNDNGKFSFKKDFMDKFNSILVKMKEDGEVENLIIEGYSK
jgi:polar amino acid transport system substrate-binding protein